MVFTIKYEWEIKDLEGFSETTSSNICSPLFGGSPDDILHFWRISLEYDFDYPQFYGVYVNLVDFRIRKPIYMCFKFQAFSWDNKMIHEASMRDFKKLTAAIGWGFHTAIYRNSCKIESIKKICVELLLEREKPKSHSANQFFAPRHVKSLGENFQNLYESGEFSDLIINCGEQIFNVHKTILVARSTVFKAMFLNNMKENSSNIIAINNVNPEALEIFLRYLYTGVIDIPFEMSESILDLAEMYDLTDLRQICIPIIQENISVSTAVDILIMTDKYRLFMTKERVFNFIQEHLKAVIETSNWKKKMPKHVGLLMELMSIIARCDEIY